MSIFRHTLEEIYQYIDEKCDEEKRFVKKMRYDQFMASDEWRDIRTVILDIYDHHCAECGATEDLHVHHLTYDRFGGDELMTDLKVLCHSCHEKAHGRTF